MVRNRAPREPRILPGKALIEQLPEFDDPPVIEVAMGVQFRQLWGFSGVRLAGLREKWRPIHPQVEEQPPLPPAVETGAEHGPTVAVRSPFAVRYWFLNPVGSRLVQVQDDRLVVNWRSAGDDPYPRYEAMRKTFQDRFDEFSTFAAEEGLGTPVITQIELNYINAIDVAGFASLGDIGKVLRGWGGMPEHHLGAPAEARVALVFPVPGIGRPPVRMYVGCDPAQRPDGSPVLFLTFMVRGAPVDASLEAALQLMDQAHAHLVKSFAEVTPVETQAQWGRRDERP